MQSCARHLWPLTSEDSLACDTYYYTDYVYNRHLRRPATFPPVVKRLAVELSLPDFTTQVCSALFQTFNLLNARQTLKSIAQPPKLPVKNLLKYITTLAYTVLHSLDQQVFSPRLPPIVFASEAVIPQGSHMSHGRKIGYKHLQSLFSTVVNIYEILAKSDTLYFYLFFT